MSDEESLNYQIEAIKTYTQVKSIFALETFKRCKNFHLPIQDCNRYGIELPSLLSGFIELFYQKGREDALKELKDKL